MREFITKMKALSNNFYFKNGSIYDIALSTIVYTLGNGENSLWISTGEIIFILDEIVTSYDLNVIFLSQDGILCHRNFALYKESLQARFHELT